MSQPVPSAAPPPEKLSQTALDLAKKFDDDLCHLIGRTLEVMAVSGIAPNEGISGICGALFGHYLDIFATASVKSHVQAFCSWSAEIKTALEARENGTNGK